ncbi:hypothetical protein, partial [Pseudomonas nitroreducens]|uniref:hypothetical protein n=1 Tax=Pseudomonas nitroreducens TaxID=46680 RepID=UPI003D278439
EALLPYLEDVDAANDKRAEVINQYRQLSNPSSEQTEQFLADYQRASKPWANACGAVVGELKKAVEQAKRQP